MAIPSEFDIYADLFARYRQEFLMSFRKIFKNGSFSVELKGNTKDEIIEEMIDMLVADGKIKNRQQALQAVRDRENKMSTGMQHGIAIPHGKTNAVDNLVVALALKKEGIDFGALDGKPCKIFIMTISPRGRTGPHISYLSDISKLLNNADIREKLLNAQNEDEMKRILLTG